MSMCMAVFYHKYIVLNTEQIIIYKTNKQTNKYVCMAVVLVP